MSTGQAERRAKEQAIREQVVSILDANPDFEKAHAKKKDTIYFTCEKHGLKIRYVLTKTVSILEKWYPARGHTPFKETSKWRRVKTRSMPEFLEFLTPENR